MRGLFDSWGLVSSGAINTAHWLLFLFGESIHVDTDKGMAVLASEAGMVTNSKSDHGLLTLFVNHTGYLSGNYTTVYGGLLLSEDHVSVGNRNMLVKKDNECKHPI